MADTAFNNLVNIKFWSSDDILKLKLKWAWWYGSNTDKATFHWLNHQTLNHNLELFIMLMNL